MHIHTIIAFALLFWNSERSKGYRLLGSDDVLGTWVGVAAQPLLLGLAALWVSRRTQRMLQRRPQEPTAAQFFNHRATFLLRLFLLGGFAASVLLTPWPDWFRFGETSPFLQIFGDLIVLSPYVLGAVALWSAAFPLERAVRAQTIEWLHAAIPQESRRWTLARHLGFNLRHHLLVVAVPMTLILFAANLTRGYEQQIVRLLRWSWAPDVLLGLFALGLFLIAPALLRRIWRTRPLPVGPLRDRMEGLCRRIGLRCREILVWETDGTTINAAVMGVVGQFRYVLLSDALLASLSPRQVEAVFGHEFGHVKHRHMQKFLGLAFVGWLAVAGLMELLARWSLAPDGLIQLSVEGIETVGILATVAFWGIGFGIVSRRFERQADLFGARCVTPDLLDCHGPCSVHGDSGAAPHEQDRVCATGAALFASALDRVAALNGIPREERSWRHSSIASRMRFLASLAGDPIRAMRFERSLRRLGLAVAVLGIMGGIGCAAYWIAVPEPAILSLGGGGL